jgi:hypothetical protein
LCSSSLKRPSSSLVRFHMGAIGAALLRQRLRCASKGRGTGRAATAARQPRAATARVGNRYTRGTPRRRASQHTQQEHKSQGSSERGQPGKAQARHASSLSPLSLPLPSLLPRFVSLLFVAAFAPLCSWLLCPVQCCRC